MRAIIYFLTFIAFSILSTTSYAQNEKTGIITVQTSDFHDLIVIPIFVNDTGPHPFILDTGSTRSLLFKDFATTLGIGQNGTSTTNVHGINATGVRPELQLSHFRIGDFDLGHTLPVEGPTWTGENNPAGILGMDLIKSYGIIVDSTEKNITFSTPENFEKLVAPSWRKIKLKSNPYNRENPKDLIFVRVNIDDSSRIPAIFDTGSQVTLMNLSAADSYFKGYQVTAGRKTWSHRGALTSKYINKFAKTSKLKIGSSKWKKTNVWIKDMSSLETINKRRRPMMIVGMNLMKNRDFAINFSANRLYISGPNDIGASYTDNFSLAFNETDIP